VVTTVSGSNFTASTAVEWANYGTTSVLQTSFIGAAQLQASVPASLLTTASTAQVAGLNPGGAPSVPLPFPINYPTPVLTSLNPASAPANSPNALSFTANGSSIYQGAAIQWTTPGGRQLSLPASFISSAQLQATVPASYLATPGTAQVAIQNPGNLLSAARPFTIASAPILSLTLSHNGNFAQGQTGYSYALMVSNAGVAPTAGTVIVTELLPSGLTLGSMAGAGWDCSNFTCRRSDVLPAGAGYPLIAVTVGVAANAPAAVINQAIASGGGSGSAGASDTTTILPAGPCTVDQSSSTSVCNLQQTINEVLGVASGNGDLNHDGIVNVVDVQIAIAALLGGG